MQYHLSAARSDAASNERPIATMRATFHDGAGATPRDTDLRAAIVAGRSGRVPATAGEHVAVAPPVSR